VRFTVPEANLRKRPNRGGDGSGLYTLRTQKVSPLLRVGPLYFLLRFFAGTGKPTIEYTAKAFNYCNDIQEGEHCYAQAENHKGNPPPNAHLRGFRFPLAFFELGGGGVCSRPRRAFSNLSGFNVIPFSLGIRKPYHIPGNGKAPFCLKLPRWLLRVASCMSESNERIILQLAQVRAMLESSIMTKHEDDNR
jgi:hypothetical protein